MRSSTQPSEELISMVMLSSTQLSQELTKGYQRLTSSLISTTFVTQELRTSGRPNGVAVGRLRRRALGGLEMTRSDAGDAAFSLCRSSEVVHSCPHDVSTITLFDGTAITEIDALPASDSRGL
jgi:hypothetical protein